jgi:hypothetical protein
MTTSVSLIRDDACSSFLISQAASYYNKRFKIAQSHSGNIFKIESVRLNVLKCLLFAANPLQKPSDPAGAR